MGQAVLEEWRTPQRSDQRWLVNPYRVVLHFREHGHLLRRLAWRETVARYRGSWLGIGWSLLEPLLMFALYTFVFSVVFQVRWGEVDDSRTIYALNLFAGLTVYNLFAETLAASPSLILNQRNFVKKSRFPLEILPLTRFLSNAIHSSFSLAILLVATVVVKHELPWTWVLLPLVLIPLSLFTLGLSFFVSSLGVFARDIGSVVRMVLMIALFLSPIFYPLSRLPRSWQSLLHLNPLAHFIEDFRRVTLETELPLWEGWAVVTIASGVIGMAGLYWFMRSKRAFGDVL